MSSNIEYSREMIDAMRDTANRGGEIRAIANVIFERFPESNHPVVPVIAYFRRAFCLSLTDVMSLREWIGTDEDDEINAELLPKIQEAKSTWLNRGHELRVNHGTENRS